MENFAGISESQGMSKELKDQ